MRGVEQAERRLLHGLGHRVVAQVRGEEGIDSGRACVAEEAVAGSAADRDGTDECVRVARGADALRGGGQPGRGQCGELPKRQRMDQLADAAETAAAERIGGVRYERTHHPQVQRAREGVGDPGVGGVGVGVRDVQGDAVSDQGVDDPALEGVGRDRRRTAQIERVVRDDQLGTELHGLVGDLLDGVDGEEYAVGLIVGVAADRADGVPGFGPLGRPQDVECGEDFRQTGHAYKVTCAPCPCCRSVPPELPRRPSPP